MKKKASIPEPARLDPQEAIGTAVLSACGTFRYRLDRDLSVTGPVAAIYGVNPSTADAHINDATIRKDMGFGRRLGWSRIIKGNLFGYRSTDIKGLRTAPDPRGPDNDRHLLAILLEADVHIAAWGPLAKLPPQLRRRWRTFCNLADQAGVKLMCFGTALDGQPRHTLMLAYETPLIEWKRP